MLLCWFTFQTHDVFVCQVTRFKFQVTRVTTSRRIGRPPQALAANDDGRRWAMGRGGVMVMLGCPQRNQLYLFVSFKQPQYTSKTPHRQQKAFDKETKTNVGSRSTSRSSEYLVIHYVQDVHQRCYLPVARYPSIIR